MCQIFGGLNVINQESSRKEERWFPKCYIYSPDNNKNLWFKLKSKRFCEKLYFLFDVDNISDLKKFGTMRS
ncbi:MAG: hypothetical protein RSD40_05595 [Bacilli bacterium]